MEQLSAFPKKKRWGDRYDGWRLRALKPVYQIIPYIMKTRVDSHVYFDDRLDITRLDAWLREQKAKIDYDLGFLHVFIAAMVRTISQKPRINRFVARQRIYARNQILISFVIKKDMSEESPSTPIKLSFSPKDTIFDIAKRVNEAVENNRGQDTSNDSDKTVRLFALCPSFIIRFLVGLMDYLDQRGHMPKAIHRASPFHTSCFITNMGSLGVKPVYHHLYEFGSTSTFIAFGKKESQHVINAFGEIVEKKFIDMKVVADERICDGHYYAWAFRYLCSLFKKPELLAQAPEKVFEDDN